MNAVIGELSALLAVAEGLGWAAVLAFLRVGGLVALMPGFGEQALPQRVKLAVVLAFTLVIAPIIAETPTLPQPALLAVVGEVQGARDLGHREVAPGQPPVRNGAILTSVPVGADCTKVTYRTNMLDGSYRNGGAKTLINTLVAQQVAWKASADNAVWDAVRKKTCFVGDAGWSGTHNGITYKGFLTNNGKAVATFYPV